MAGIATLRRMLAKLREGRPASAGRTDEPVLAGAAFRQRMQAQADTDAWLKPLLPALPAHLHAALRQCTAVQGDTAITTLPDLLQQVALRRDSLHAELGRAGLQRTAAEQALLDDLAELLARLPPLAEPGAAGGIPHGPA